jgi:hypothetical protein
MTLSARRERHATFSLSAPKMFRIFLAQYDSCLPRISAAIPRTFTYPHLPHNQTVIHPNPLFSPVLIDFWGRNRYKWNRESSFAGKRGPYGCLRTSETPGRWREDTR